MSVVINGDGFITGSAGVGKGGSETNVAFYESDQTITANYTIGTNKNAMSVGDITIDTGVTVTIPTGSVWSIV